MPQPTGHRVTLAAYIHGGRHVITETRAKPIRQIAAETGMSVCTARHWLTADHYDEWLHYWPTADALAAEWKPKDKQPTSSWLDDLPDFDPAAIGAAANVR